MLNSVNNMTKGLKLPRVYSLEMLSAKWNTDKKNIIAACYENDNLRVFLNLTSEFLLQESKSLFGATNVLDISIQISNKHQLEHYAQLAKYPKIEQQISLKYFYTNEWLKRTVDHRTSVAIVAPSCKQILGQYQFVEVLRDTKPKLYFMADEIDAYELTDDFVRRFGSIKVKNKEAYIANDKLATNKRIGVKEQRMGWVTNALNLVINIAYQNGITIDKENMPGTKREFGDLLQLVDIKLKCLMPTTISEDYLKPLGYKFRAGTHSGKCKVFKEVNGYVLDSIKGKN